MTFQDVQAVIIGTLGLDSTQLVGQQMIARAVVVYVVSLLIVRFGETRFLGKSTVFDVILGIIFGSVVSRAINGTAAFFPTLAAALVLVVLHWLFAVIAFRSSRFGTLVKGNTELLIKDGNIVWESMARGHISYHDLMMALRLQLHTNTLDGIREARLERSGDISFITEDTPPPQ